MHKGSLEFALTEHACVIMLNHEITWEVSADLDMFLECIIAEIVFKEIYFDLSMTTYMDSTSLGVLAHFKRKASDLKILVSVLNPGDIILKNLQDVGLHKVLDIQFTQLSGLSIKNTIPSCKKHSPREISSLVKKTHLALISLNEKNRELFSSIVSDIDSEEQNEQ